MIDIDVKYLQWPETSGWPVQRGATTSGISGLPHRQDGNLIAVPALCGCSPRRFPGYIPYRQ